MLEEKRPARREEIVQLPSGLKVNVLNLAYDLDALKSSEDAYALMSRLQERSILIEGQIEASKSEAQAFGRSPDPIWMRKANEALKWTKFYRQKVQDIYGSLRKSEKAMKHTLFERAFIEAARKRLPEDTFNELMSAAHEVSQAKMKEAANGAQGH